MLANEWACGLLLPCLLSFSNPPVSFSSFSGVRIPWEDRLESASIVHSVPLIIPLLGVLFREGLLLSPLVYLLFILGELQSTTAPLLSTRSKGGVHTSLSRAKLDVAAKVKLANLLETLALPSLRRDERTCA